MMHLLIRHSALALTLMLAGATNLGAQASGLPATTPSTQKVPMTQHAAGPFDVTVTPRAPAEGAAAPVGIMSLDKTYHGDLEARATGEMLANRSAGTGAAVYVALEQVTGTLGGRRGSFVLAHVGTMTKDAQQLSVTIAPGSGTEGLAGISGTMTIRIDGKAHFYTLDYTLP